MKRFLAATLLACLTTFAAPSAFAYQFLQQCGPTWSNVPVDYWVNSSGYSGIPLTTVESIFQDSFDEWGAPCCSEFGAIYRGRTSATAIPPGNQGNIVLGFLESGWPYGSGVIGVTSTLISGTCRMVGAPIVFNGQHYNFTTAGGGTDLQSIATHEIGHLLGLDHSTIPDATMFRSYSGGVQSRNLHQDDRNAVCDLYFAAQCSCSSTSQCGPGEVCMNSVCRLPPCSSDADCDDGLSCLTNGDCGIPPCNSNADCQDGYKCDGNRCVSSCPVCRTCATDADCGGVAAQCIDLGEGMRCHVFCNLNAPTNDLVCPGDSTCWNVPDGQGGLVPVCGSPTADLTGLCTTGTELNPQSYVCTDDGIADQCNSASDCSGDDLCVNTTQGRRCQAPEDQCADVTCGDGLTCNPENGLCYREDISNNVPGTNGNNANNTTGGNNASGNNTTGGNNGTGNNGTGITDDSDADEQLVIIYGSDNSSGSDDESCAMAAGSSVVPGELLLLIAAFFWRRRR